MITFFLEKSNTQPKIKMTHIINTELCLHDYNLYWDKDFLKDLKIEVLLSCNQNTCALESKTRPFRMTEEATERGPTADH